MLPACHYQIKSETVLMNLSVASGITPHVALYRVPPFWPITCHEPYLRNWLKWKTVLRLQVSPLLFWFFPGSFWPFLSHKLSWQYLVSQVAASCWLKYSLTGTLTSTPSHLDPFLSLVFPFFLETGSSCTQTGLELVAILLLQTSQCSAYRCEHPRPHLLRTVIRRPWRYLVTKLAVFLSLFQLLTTTCS